MARLLIVEDEEAAADALAALLELDGFDVTRAPNGKRAIEMLAQVRPELIITDYMMPVMDGIEMARSIRATPGYADVPILMTSGVSESALETHASLLSAFLRKPFRIEALLGHHRPIAFPRWRSNPRLLTYCDCVSSPKRRIFDNDLAAANGGPVVSWRRLVIQPIAYSKDMPCVLRSLVHLRNEVNQFAPSNVKESQ